MSSPVLICELEHALDGGSAVDRGVALTEHGHHLLVLGDPGDNKQEVTEVETKVKSPVTNVLP